MKLGFPQPLAFVVHEVIETVRIIWPNGLARAVVHQHIPAKLCSRQSRRCSDCFLNSYNFLLLETFGIILPMTVPAVALQLNVV